ncbi:MAG: CCA tRNA nucleotidyltransferase [Patescibacteria group bacterium]
MKISAYQIVELLQKNGHTAYWAGGCVRDVLLGIHPKDYDIATSAHPEQIEKLLEKTIPIGRDFGVILAIVNGHHFEIATFRRDSEDSDGRRPSTIHFTDAEQDAKRRDFTINGLFYDPIADKIIDYVEGQGDLEARLVRFIGDPEKRIQEDHLRILRAIRMKNAFDFQYHPDTYVAIKKNAKLAGKVSSERIRDELNKMIEKKNMRKAFEDMEDTGVLEVIVPELVRLKGLAQPYEFHQEGDVWEHAMRSVEALPEDASIEVRWATLLHDIGKFDTFKLAERIRYDGHASRSRDIARDILSRLNFSRKFVENVCWIVEHHMSIVQLLEMPLARRRHWFLNPEFSSLLQVFRADALGTVPGNLTLYEKIAEQYKKDLTEMPVRPEPLLSGEEIMAATGLKPGKEIGKILEKIHELQLAGEMRTKEEALKSLTNISSLSKTRTSDTDEPQKPRAPKAR